MNLTLPSLPSSTSLLDAALAYARNGWRVVPMHSAVSTGTCSCSATTSCRTVAKHPRTIRGVHDASLDEALIREWWNRWPDSNVGIAVPEGVVVFDFDHESTIHDLESAGRHLPASVITSTSAGRAHYWYSTALTVPNRVGVVAGLDLRSAGSIIIVPPSRHRSGATYTFADETQIAEAPDWLSDLLESKQTDIIADPLASILDGVEQGVRDSTLWRYACRLVAKRLDEQEQERLILMAARECRPPFQDHKALRKLEAARSFANLTFRLSDAGNAERFVKMHGLDVRFCPVVGWLVWDGRRWSPDMSGELMRRALESARLLYLQADRAADQKEAARTYSWARASESANRLKATLEIAASHLDVVVAPERLDADPMLLNVMNGTIDLRSGTIRRHDPLNLITKLAPVHFDQKATAKLWPAFLERIMGQNTDLIEFLQRAVGYTLTGDVGEHVLFLLYGTGANGKSTFLETIRTLLGDYAMQADFSTFTNGRASQGGAPRNDVARLKGARFVSGVEMEAGSYLSESTVKQMTGGDTVTARFLYKEFFEYKPAFKLFLAANHRPHVRQTDEGIWRRIRLVPFTVTIPPDERDKKLPARLAGELPGILNWALDGVRLWQENGLRAPKEVDDATNDYREDNDPLRDFLEAKCSVGAAKTASFSLLYRAYSDYCGQMHEDPMTKKQFGESLTERGITADKGSGGTRIRRGIALRTPEDDFDGL